MKVVRIRTLDGPNVFTHDPVVILTLDVAEFDGRETCEFPGLTETLLQVLPGLADHTCSRGYPGGFVERLLEGTYLGHVVEHVAIELGQPSGATGNYGKTVRTPEPRCYDVVVQSRIHAVTRHLLEQAAVGVEALARGDAWKVESVLEEASRLAAKTDLGPSTRAIVDAAAARGIPWFRLNDHSLVQLGYGSQRRLIEAAMTDRTSAVALDIVQDKAQTKDMLARAFIPVPEGRTVTDADAAVAAFEDIGRGGPVVVKPLDGSQGKGVSVGVGLVDEVRQAFAEARRYSANVVVEEALTGDDYRLLVVGGRLVAASRRSPPCVTGDGTRTVAELVAEANKDARRGEGHERPLTKMRLDDAARCCLRKQGLEVSAVPAAGVQVRLRENANLSTGGTAADVTDVVHSDVRSMCERAARVVGLDICGVDLVSPDITRPPGRGTGIVELNTSPGLRMHMHPGTGAPRAVAGAIVDEIFPPGHNGRIPIVSITGTNGKTTVARLVAHALASTGARVGLTTTDGVWIDGTAVARGDMTGPRSARVVLGDPLVDAAVLETARGGIVRAGLGYDWSDVGVVTNIQLDHVGQDGIESLEDIVRIKSLVAERVKRGGTLVLNADDSVVMQLPDQPRIARLEHEVRLFSVYPNHVKVRRHVASGGTAYIPWRGWVVEQSAAGQTPIVEIRTVPVALGGAAHFLLSNVIAAVAACRASGVDAARIAAAFREFSPHVHNEGRSNLYEIPRGYVLVDYGHNPAALDAIGHLAARWVGRRVSGVVGLPGDRADWLLQEAARVAARAFDRIILREDEDLRGRVKGEVPLLLRDAISREAPGRECLLVEDEAWALRAAIDTMEDGEVVVAFYEHLDKIREVLEERGATPAARVEPVRVSEDGVFRIVRRA